MVQQSRGFKGDGNSKRNASHVANGEQMWQHAGDAVLPQIVGKFNQTESRTAKHPIWEKKKNIWSRFSISPWRCRNTGSVFRGEGRQTQQWSKGCCVSHSSETDHVHHEVLWVWAIVVSILQLPHTPKLNGRKGEFREQFLRRHSLKLCHCVELWSVYN